MCLTISTNYYCKQVNYYSFILLTVCHCDCSH